MLHVCLVLQRGDAASELPWAFREPADAEALLRAAATGGLPQRRVERLALLHLLMRLHREAHARSGEAPGILFTESGLATLAFFFHPW